MPIEPICEPLPRGWTAEAVFGKLSDRPGLFFLDSASGTPPLGRWSIIGSDPYEVLSPDRTAGGGPGAWSALEARLRESGRPPASPSLPGPFAGGAVGYLSYDLGRRFERIPASLPDPLSTPDFWLGLYDRFALFDRRTGDGWILSTGDPLEGKPARRRARERLADLRRTLLAAGSPRPAPFSCGPPRSAIGRERYEQMVRRCLEWIAAGDIYQVNLSRRIDASFAGSPADLYAVLRRVNPAPFAAYLDAGRLQILSCSPERFLAVDGRRVETRPIKGTRPRGANAAEDARLAAELDASPKDRAELVMIVDLLRNDLGRVCSYGSVRTESVGHLESFESVHHRVGVIRGELREGATACDLIRACFPGGSITGAPKIRAMEIIEELEDERRGVHFGSIGYIGFDGRCDLNLAIRTLVVRDGEIHLRVGGGIVADSSPAGEYEETCVKAEGILRALRPEVPAR